jgi:hypothetical protein
MKNDLPYFSHDNNTQNHPKMMALLARYGMAGYGMFWVLNEIIAQSPGAVLDISRQINRLNVVQRLRLTEPETDEFLAFLADPDIDLINLEAGKITTDRTTEDLKIVQKARTREQEKYNKKRGRINSPGENANSPGENANSPGENIQSRVDRVDKIRVDGGDPKLAKLSKSACAEPPPPFLLKKIKESASRAGFPIEDNLAANLASGTDPTWFEGPYTFPEYVAQEILSNRKYRGLPKHERRALFLKALWAWDNLRAEYPDWRKERMAGDVPEDVPKVCPDCGKKLGAGLKCPNCGGFYVREDTGLNFVRPEPVELSKQFREHIKATGPPAVSDIEF